MSASPINTYASLNKTRKTVTSPSSSPLLFLRVASPVKNLPGAEPKSKSKSKSWSWSWSWSKT